jgi:hypothetical protein
MAENHDTASLVWFVFVRQKSATEHGRDAEEGKEIRSHNRTLQSCGLAATRHDEVAAAIRSYVLKDRVLRAEIQEVGV